jgi:predicted secreted protein
MNLSKEQIQFIDQYLKKSEVVFDDLRMELVDHTASAVAYKMVEEDIDFYDAFKNYMVENKKSILKAGMVHHTFNFTLAISKFARFLFSKEVAIFSMLFLFLGLKPLKFRLMQDLENLQIILISSVCIFAIIWWIVLYGVFKKRIFALENNLILMTIGYQMVNISRFFWSENIENEFYVTLISGLLAVLFLAFMLKISINFYSKNKNLYAAD